MLSVRILILALLVCEFHSRYEKSVSWTDFSSYSWVFSSELSASLRSGHSYYTPSKSKTSKQLSGVTWSITYGDQSSETFSSTRSASVLQPSLDKQSRLPRRSRLSYNKTRITTASLVLPSVASTLSAQHHRRHSSTTQNQVFNLPSLLLISRKAPPVRTTSTSSTP
jgi:hypothetical protein